MSATPEPIGSANSSTQTCESCVSKNRYGSEWYCHRAFEKDKKENPKKHDYHFSRDDFARNNPLDLTWSACSEFEAESKYAVLKIYLEENFNRISAAGDLWVNKDYTVIFQGDQIGVTRHLRDYGGWREELGTFDNEDEVISLLRGMIQGELNSTEKARRTAAHLKKAYERYLFMYDGAKQLEPQGDLSWTDQLSDSDLMKILLGKSAIADQQNGSRVFIFDLPAAERVSDGRYANGLILNDELPSGGGLMDPWGRHYGIRWSESDSYFPPALKSFGPKFFNGEIDSYPEVDWENLRSGTEDHRVTVWSWGNPEEKIAPIIT